MSDSVRARICWVPSSEGGRSAPPSGNEYSTVARFEARKEQWPDEAWSVVISLPSSTENRNVIEAEIRLLMPRAPQELLAVGRKFSLFEGRRLVAEGEVVECDER